MPHFPEGMIRGDHDQSNFMTGGGNFEHQIGPALVDGRIAQLIEDAQYQDANETIEPQPTVSTGTTQRRRQICKCALRGNAVFSAINARPA
jgi:hypothetical protein